MKRSKGKRPKRDDNEKAKERADALSVLKGKTSDGTLILKVNEVDWALNSESRSAPRLRIPSVVSGESPTKHPKGVRRGATFAAWEPCA